jgi:hypothetical protein
MEPSPLHCWPWGILSDKERLVSQSTTTSSNVETKGLVGKGQSLSILFRQSFSLDK